MVGTVVAFIPDIQRIPEILEQPVVYVRAKDFSIEKSPVRKISALLGWGRKGTGLVAESLGKKYQIPHLILEDGFLRSVGVGAEGEISLSFVIDQNSIYYDATTQSGLEKIILEGDWSDELLEQARMAMDLIRKNRLSKYNGSPDVTLPKSQKKRVLVIDQTAGDSSIIYGRAGDKTFERMLKDAVTENPDSEIIVKYHPDTMLGQKSGVLPKFVEAYSDRITIFREKVNPISLIEQVDKVYVVSSHFGFEALLCHRPVFCYGIPWYACWGLTVDRNTNHLFEEIAQRRNKTRRLEELFAAAYLQYSRYIDTNTGKLGSIFSVIDTLIMKRDFSNQNKGDWIAFGFKPWKEGPIRAFFFSTGGKIDFAFSPKELTKSMITPRTRIMVWGDGYHNELRRFSAVVPITRVEDGFLRSVGLGSEYLFPVSLAIDHVGMYYDPSGPSALENLLNDSDNFSKEEVKRASDLRKELIRLRLTKYNLSGTKLTLNSRGRKIIFVPGQIDSDASIKLGCQDIRSDRDLLKAIRENRPEAFILYKPHPDIIFGKMKNKESVDSLKPFYDQIVRDADILDCIDLADEVHTMTSLTGFEALLRQKKVVCYGLPFYAGWGLTEDRFSIPRRKHRLTLDELVVGALIKYPRYISPDTGEFISVEEAVRYLARQQRDGIRPVPVRVSPRKRFFRVIKRFWRQIKMHYAH